MSEPRQRAGCRAARPLRSLHPLISFNYSFLQFLNYGAPASAGFRAATHRSSCTGLKQCKDCDAFGAAAEFRLERQRMLRRPGIIIYMPAWHFSSVNLIRVIGDSETQKNNTTPNNQPKTGILKNLVSHQGHHSNHMNQRFRREINNSPKKNISTPNPFKIYKLIGVIWIIRVIGDSETPHKQEKQTCG